MFATLPFTESTYIYTFVISSSECKLQFTLVPIVVKGLLLDLFMNNSRTLWTSILFYLFSIVHEKWVLILMLEFNINYVNLLTYTYSIMPLKYDLNINQNFDFKKCVCFKMLLCINLLHKCYFFLITMIWCKFVTMQVKNRLGTMRKCNALSIMSCMIKFDIVNIVSLYFDWEVWFISEMISSSLCSISLKTDGWNRIRRWEL